MYFKCSVHQCALKTVSGNTRLQEVWHFSHEQKIFGHQKFFWRKKIIKIGVFATLNLKFFWGSSPRPPAKCNPPFLYPGYVPEGVNVYPLECQAPGAALH